MRRQVVDGRKVAAVKQVAVESVVDEIDRLVCHAMRIFARVFEDDFAFECLYLIIMQ